jgi:hypothetical protein
MTRFYGVATKYLLHYLGWRRMLERYLSTIQPQHYLLEGGAERPPTCNWDRAKFKAERWL